MEIAISTFGALLALVISLTLIIKKTPAAYALMLGAFVGGFIGCFDIEFVVSKMLLGAQDICKPTMRVLAAGVLAGVLIQSGSALKIAYSIKNVLGEKFAIASIILSTFILTASGVFIDVAVLTVAPIALVLAAKSKYSRMAILIALIGGGKSGNIISPNPNTIVGAENFGVQMTDVMFRSIPAAICGLIVTIAISYLLIKKGDIIQDSENISDEKVLPSLWASLIGPATAIFLLILRPLANINIDPMIALPVGGIVSAICMGKFLQLNNYIKLGLEKMTPIAVLLLGTGTIAGIIQASTLKTNIADFMKYFGIADALLAPLSGILMSGAAASTVAGATIASATFADIITASGVNAIWGAVMVCAGATVLDHLPHGSFFHVSGGSVNMDFKNRIKLIPYESLIGGTLAFVATLSYYIAQMFFGI